MKNYDRLTLNEVANAYRKMILNEAPWPPPDGSGLPNWWEDPDNADYLRDDPRNKPWSTHNPEGRKYWREKVVGKYRRTRPVGPTPSQLRDRDALSRFQRGYKPRPTQPPIPGLDQQIQDIMRQTERETPRPTRKPTAPRTPAPKPGARPMRGVRPAAGVAGGLLTLLSLYSIYQDLFGDDGTEVDVIPDDGQVIKPINVDQPGLNLQPLYVPPHQRDPRNYPGQHPVRPPKAPAGGNQGSGGGIGGGGGMGM